MRRPRFIAEQARNAQGPLGRLVAFIMARETRGANRRAIEALDIKRSDHVLDLGCGHGHSLTEMAARAAAGYVVGVDPSELMVEVASRRNRTLINAARVYVVHASAESLPLPESTFDKVLCVHVLYFWTDIGACLREIARVLKPGGRLALLFRTKTDSAVAAFPPEIYRFSALIDLTTALEAAGFDVSPSKATEPALLLAEKRLTARSELSQQSISPQ
jgi:ubiquinone/menaquinone biosynthesis C-methylase UbiE